MNIMENQVKAHTDVLIYMGLIQMPDIRHWLQGDTVVCPVVKASKDSSMIWKTFTVSVPQWYKKIMKTMTFSTKTSPYT